MIARDEGSREGSDEGGGEYNMLRDASYGRVSGLVLSIEYFHAMKAS